MKKKIWSFAIAICLIVVELGGALLVKAEAQGASQAVVETEVSCGIREFEPEVMDECRIPEHYFYVVKKGGVQTKAVSKNPYYGKYGLERLDTENEKILYGALERAAFDFHSSEKDGIVTTSASGTNYYAVALDVEALDITTNELGIAIVCFLYDHPEFFWSKGYSYFQTNDGSIAKVTLQCQEEYVTGDIRAQMREKIDTSIQSYLDLIVGVKGDYEKELILHDALNKNITYAYSLGGSAQDERWAHTIEGVFSGEYNSAVCEGYAKAFQLLLSAAGIESVYVVGKASGTGHAWNQVKIDKQWYNVDITWNDTANAGSHKYFNVPDSTFLIAHRAYTEDAPLKVGEWCYELNACTAEEASYKVKGDYKQGELCELKVRELEHCSIRMYNGGVEVLDGTSVEKGTIIECVLIPDFTFQTGEILFGIGEKTETIQKEYDEKGYSFLFEVDKNVEISGKIIDMSAIIEPTMPISTEIPKPTGTFAIVTPKPTGEATEVVPSPTNTADKNEIQPTPSLAPQDTEIVSSAPENPVQTEGAKILQATLNKKSYTITGYGKKLTLLANVLPEGQEKNLVWKSTKPKVATVENGIVTSVKKGNTYIQLCDAAGTIYDTCKVTVKAPYIKIVVPKQKIKKNKKMRVSAKVYGASNDVSWYVINKSGKATIGLFDGKFKAKKKGVVWVKAQVGNVVAKRKITIY